MLTFVVIGIIQGAVIGLIALGIVLVYKGSRVFNFAQAEFATLGGFFLYFMLEVVGLPYPLAMLGALILAGLVGFLMERLVVRPLFDAPRVTLLVATAGVALFSIAAQIIVGGLEIRTLAPAISGGGFRFLGATVSPQQLLVLFVLGILAVASSYFFNKTDLGLAVLATSQEPVATELVGIGTKRMSSFIWTLAAALGGIAGMLQAPDTTFTPGFMTTNYLLLGFTGAVLGGVTSLAGAFVGGQLIGIVHSLGAYFDSTFLKPWIESAFHTDIPGIPDLLVFLMLMTVLLVRPKGLLGSEV